MVSAIEIDSLRKVYGATTALRSASLVVRPGELVGLLGANGAGKSTLVRILSGIERADGGIVRVFGEGLTDHHGRLGETGYRRVRRLGCAVIHQDLGLIETATVAENIALGSAFPCHAGIIDWRNVRATSDKMFADLGIDIDVSLTVADLPIAMQAVVAVVRALALQPRVLVMDEPTAAVPAEHARLVFEIVKQLCRNGLACLLITHRLDEVVKYCDRLVVMRNGLTVLQSSVENVDRGRIIAAIAGTGAEKDREKCLFGTEVVAESWEENREPVSPMRGSVAFGLGGHRNGLQETSLGHVKAARAVSMENVTAGRVRRLFLHANTGEIVGVTGAPDSEYFMVNEVLFGIMHEFTGSVEVFGREIRSWNISAALRAGIAYVPGDRIKDGLAMSLPAYENLNFNPRTSFRLPRRRVELLGARRQLFNGKVYPADPEMTMDAFSGGNAQKVLLTRWLSSEPKILLLTEPTAGVDIPSKEHIYSLLRSYVVAGGVVVTCSSDAQELVDICDRVYVLGRERTAVLERGSSLTSEALLEESFNQAVRRT